MDYVFAGLNPNILFRKSASKMHFSWMILRKQGAVNDQMLRLGCCLPPYQNSWLRACPHQENHKIRIMHVPTYCHKPTKHGPQIFAHKTW